MAVGFTTIQSSLRLFGGERVSTGADPGGCSQCGGGGRDIDIRITTVDDGAAEADIIFAPDGGLRVNDDTLLTFGTNEDSYIKHNYICRYDTGV